MNLKMILIVVIIAAVTVAMLRARSATVQAPSKDGQTLAQLAKAGSDLKKPHRIDFFFYFPSRDAAEKATPRLTALGLSTRIDRAAKGSDWLIRGQKTMVPTEGELQKLRREFDAIASSLDGTYDGWGSEVVK